MKQLLYRLLFGCMTLLLLAACEADNAPFENNADGSNCIILNLEASSVPVRATVESNKNEIAVDHIDVFVFKTDETLFHYEHLQLTEANAGKAALMKKRSEFGPNENYKVYIVANSNLDNFDDVTNLTKLKSKFQEDKDIHLTGLSNLEGVPQFFLMDGIAKASSTSADNMVILNDGEPANNTELKVDLKRAAAKIIVHMKKGNQVQFSTTPGQDGALYYMRNLPYSSTVLSDVDKDAELRTSDAINYFDWKTEEITVTAYAYEHKWENVSTLEKEPRLIVNIPLTYTPEDPQSKAETLKNSYYQIPVSRDQLLERNTCYETTVTINAPGGSDPSEPLKLEPINYTVNEWIGKPINIGGETVNLAYLTLNKYDMEMHNLTDDNTLEFASSSNVKAKITKVWYIDKFGQEKTLSQVRTNSNQWSESYGKNLCEITITPDENITGNIHVHGTVPENNTIRYITFELTNEDNITRTVTVAQYPLEYITNIQGWYSYRMDFGGTNYENPGPNRYVTAKSYSGADKWLYSTSADNGFFRSKVAQERGEGKSALKFYTFYKPSVWGPDKPTEQPQIGESSSGLNNARMYHVRITATSGEYTLGRPRMIDGKTDGGKDNEVLVSPSFMIASQLGAVNSNACKSVEMAASHCKQYVETYKDKEGKVHHVKGWRLPTKAEVAIIMKFQKKEDAIDVVLSGNQYWCASGCVKTSTGEIIPSTGSPVRCIRDAYDIEK